MHYSRLNARLMARLNVAITRATTALYKHPLGKPRHPSPSIIVHRKTLLAGTFSRSTLPSSSGFLHSSRVFVSREALWGRTLVVVARPRTYAKPDGHKGSECGRQARARLPVASVARGGVAGKNLRCTKRGSRVPAHPLCSLTGGWVTYSWSIHCGYRTDPWCETSPLLPPPRWFARALIIHALQQRRIKVTKEKRAQLSL